MVLFSAITASRGGGPDEGQGRGSGAPSRVAADGHAIGAIVRHAVQPVGDCTGQPVGDRTAHPVGDRTVQPVGDRTPQPVGDCTGQPVGDRTAHPVGDRTAQSVGDRTVQPVADCTGQSVVGRVERSETRQSPTATPPVGFRLRLYRTYEHPTGEHPADGRTARGNRTGPWNTRARPLLGLAAGLALLAGCGSSPQEPSRPASTYQPSDPSSEIERVPAGRLARAEGAAPIPVRVAVRGPDRADLKTVEGLVQESKEDTQRVGTSAQTVTKALGQASPALQATTVTLGALLMPASLGLEIYGQRQQDAIVRTLREIDLLTLLRAELVRRAAPVGASERPADLTVTVKTYGLAPRSTPCPTCALCVVVDAEVVVTRDGAELLRDNVAQGPWRRSVDVPPPVCATMDEFSADGGLRLRHGVIDAAQSLAAVTINRLPALAWKP
jgi:hypothetical protein